MDRVALLQYLKQPRYAVEASVSPSGVPQAAVVGIVVSDQFDVFFDTEGTTRKARNLRLDRRVALVVGWDDAWTAQIEGMADEPTGEELAALKQIYFAKFPDGREREAWPHIAYFRIRPSWIRFSDFRGPEPVVVEFDPSSFRGRESGRGTPR